MDNAVDTGTILEDVASGDAASLVGGWMKASWGMLSVEKYVLACRQLFADGIRFHGDRFFNRLDQWYEELELGTAAVRSGASVKESILQGFENPAFGAFKDQERLQRLKERCEKELSKTGGL